MEAGSLVGVLAVFALVAVNGFFVAAEFGLVSLPVTHCRLRAECAEYAADLHESRVSIEGNE